MDKHTVSLITASQLSNRTKKKSIGPAGSSITSTGIYFPADR